MIVNKSFIAELPADFAGGVIDIGLKTFPDQRQGSVSISLGYNPLQQKLLNPINWKNRLFRIWK